jgi:hypothetical protein
MLEKAKDMKCDWGHGMRFIFSYTDPESNNSFDYYFCPECDRIARRKKKARKLEDVDGVPPGYERHIGDMI